MRTKRCKQTDAENMSSHPTPKVVRIELLQGRPVSPGEPSRLLEDILVLDNNMVHGLWVERVQHVALYQRVALKPHTFAVGPEHVPRTDRADARLSRTSRPGCGGT